MVPTSPRRRQEDSADDEVERPSDEEKLKVVVRVRPLQKNEEPWSTSHSLLNDKEDIDLASNRKRQQGVTSVASANAIAQSESALSLQEKTVTWEKNGQIKMLLADAVFNGDASQDDVFHSVKDCIDGLLAGFDCSVFAYGQTGTGKTHTMSGLPHRGVAVDDCEDGSFTMSDNLGVVPRCIHRLFDQIDSSDEEGVLFSVYCSFVEIYNEKIYDILSSDVGVSVLNTSGASSTYRSSQDTRAGWNRPQPIKEAPSLQIRQKLDGTVFVDGLTSRRISSRTEMLRAFREGSMNREVRDNLYNQHSSRGHSIFQVTLRRNIGGATPAKASDSPKRAPSMSTPPDSNAVPTTSRLSRLFFVDLAGSEKWHANGSDLTERYATELSSINKSLSALTNCVLALTQKERPHVPYRDSVLTRLLQSCLQGQGRTAFIVTISPARESFEESFATLRFAERLKALRCRPIRRKILSNEPLMGEQRVYYENQIHTMRMEVNRLRELLKKAHRRNQEIADTSAATANAALLEENRRLKELLMHSERNRLAERGDRITGKPSKGLSMTSVDPSPQRQAARQIIASGQRPFTEEEVVPKTITASDMDASAHNLPSTPQPRTKPNRNDDEGHKSTDTSPSTEEREYSTLVNRLQDKEAHLNWILEAELEAQNTRSGKLNSRANENDENSHEQSSIAKSTVTRSWAVERVLRKNLVVVPPPLRAPASTADHTLMKPPDTKDVVNPHPPRSLPAPTDAEKMLSPRQRQATQLSGSTMPVKLDSPRHPAHTNSATLNGSKPSATQPRRSIGQSLFTLLPKQKVSKQEEIPPTQVKAASLLKLVGTSDAKGKSKEELVDDYKRARRAELEAMLRTMVHQQ